MESHWNCGDTADRYVQSARPPRPLEAQMHEVMLRILAAREEPLLRFCDLGCGDGRVGDAVLQACPRSVGLFVDLWEPVLDTARRRLADCRDRAEFLQLNIGSGGWRDVLAARGPFDAIVSGFAIHHVPTPRKPQFYRDLLGLLSPGGVLVNLDHVASPTPRLEAVHDRFYVEQMNPGLPDGPALDDLVATHARREDRSAGLTADVLAQVQWLREAGFVDVDIYFKCFELAVVGGFCPPSGI